jgi:hypothetical protein
MFPKNFFTLADPLVLCDLKPFHKVAVVFGAGERHIKEMRFQ